LIQSARAAAVKRPTFYDYFADRESCFLAAHDELARGLSERVRAAIAAADPAQALYAAIAALVDFARAQNSA
jgi:AcrR family transcriptional regulator